MSLAQTARPLQNEIHGSDHAEHSGHAVQIEHLACQHLGHGSAYRSQRQQERGTQRPDAGRVQLGAKIQIEVLSVSTQNWNSAPQTRIMVTL